MKLTIPKYEYQISKSIVTLVLALLLLIGQAIFFLFEFREIQEQETQQENAGLILLRLREVLEDLQDAETGQRGYLLTGAEVYLDPYRRADAMIGGHLQSAKNLLSKNPVQTSRLRSLEQIIDLKRSELAQTIQLRKNQQIEAALKRVQDGSGKKYMDQAREVLGKLMDDTRSARSKTNREISERINKARYALVSIAFTIIVMVMVATLKLLTMLHSNAELSRRLALESTHDELTGLPNRRMFYTWFDKVLDQAKRRGTSAAVVYLDLDGFKRINDDFGHKTGDAVLIAVSKRLNQVLRSADLLARFGGDEFAISISDDVSHATLVVLATRLLAAVQAPLLDNLPAGSIGLSIGVALFPKDGANFDDIIRAADLAMYQAKHTGKGRFCFASSEIFEPEFQI